MKYVIEIKVNGEWKVWNRTNDSEIAQLMYNKARCYGECRIVER